MNNTTNNTLEHKEIPVNSPSILVDQTSSRFSDALWVDKIKEKTIILAGVGGIGSHLAFLLSRVKPRRIVLFDPDTVEETNLSGQLYSLQDIGKSKVHAISNIMGSFSRYYPIYEMQSPFDDSMHSNIMICGFDNMAARKDFYYSWKSKNLDNKQALFIDGRLAAEEFQIFCIRGDDYYHMNEYENKWLFSDEEAEATICSYKQTSHCACMIASLMTNLLINHIANECNPIIDRDVPFMTTYDASTMYLKTLS